MLDFEEELKKFRPIMEISDIEAGTKEGERSGRANPPKQQTVQTTARQNRPEDGHETGRK